MRLVFFLLMPFWFVACNAKDDSGYKPQEETTINWDEAANSSSFALIDKINKKTICKLLMPVFKSF